MAEKVLGKYYVVKVVDVEFRLTDAEREILGVLIEKLDNKNSYLICNQDEPYSETVWQAILAGEDAKDK
jgi:hypothetical protein